jgi:ubiquinol-cytochrome c reductase cytochrome c1 subunit
MKELKVLAVVVFFSALIYIGVEPYAHSVLHPHVESKNFTYPEHKAVKKGDAAAGESLVMSNCIACHSIESKGMTAPMNPVMSSATYGVNPPDLSSAGAIYDEKFLAAFIKDPASATKVTHKFADGTKSHPMPGYGWMSEKEIADMVAYLKSIAKAEYTPKEVFVDACGRCHAVRYDNKVMGEKWTQIGQKPKFKYEKDSLSFDIKVLEYQDHLKNYMGKLPPDLSIIIRARGENFLKTFIENPQSTLLKGTAMPAVGLNEASYGKVMTYLTEVGDPSKKDREAFGPWFLLYMVIFTVLAVLWKKSVWKKLK